MSQRLNRNFATIAEDAISESNKMETAKGNIDTLVKGIEDYNALLKAALGGQSRLTRIFSSAPSIIITSRFQNPIDAHIQNLELKTTGTKNSIKVHVCAADSRIWFNTLDASGVIRPTADKLEDMKKKSPYTANEMLDTLIEKLHYNFLKKEDKARLGNYLKQLQNPSAHASMVCGH